MSSLDDDVGAVDVGAAEFWSADDESSESECDDDAECERRLFPFPMAPNGGGTAKLPVPELDGPG